MKNESWLPLGILWKQEWFLFWTGLFLSAGVGLVLLLCRCLLACQTLYGHSGTMGSDGAMVRVLLPGTLVPLLSGLLYGPLLCLLALALSLAGVVIYHFLCHYQGGRSIYWIRLLPQFGELWRRCLSALALVLLPGAALTAAAILLCALCHHHLAPMGHPPPEPWGGLPLGWIEDNHA